MIDVACPIADWAERRPEATAIRDGARGYSYAMYESALRDSAARLVELRIGEGELLAFPGHPALANLLLFPALFRVGAVACPANPRTPIRRIVESLEAIGCRRLVLPNRLELEGIKTIRMQTILDEPDEVAPSPARSIPLERPATVVFTSGSTGEHKAALHAYRNHLVSARRSNQNIPLAPGDEWLLSLPLNHVAGIGVLFRCWIAGATVVLPAPEERLESAVTRPGLTHVSLVATQLFRLLRNAEAANALRGFKAILVGGSAVPAKLVRRAHDAGLPLHVSYGLTEMATQVTTTPPGASLETLLTSGSPLDPDAVVLAPDGEILVRGEQLFLGYVRRDGSRDLPLSDDGWFLTGDLGRFDAEDRLMVLGRKDNRFVCGGENIQPEEIERALCRIPEIDDAIVVPLEDEEYGTIPVAFVHINTDVAPDEADIKGHLRDALPGYAIPRRISPWPAVLDRSDTKANRRVLAQMARRLFGRLANA